MTIRTSTTRRPRPWLTTAMVLLFLLVAYFGSYWLNTTVQRIVYFAWKRKTTESREVPEFVAFQHASEVVFWPADKLHGWIDPGRFDYDPNDQGQWPDFRDEWQ